MRQGTVVLGNNVRLYVLSEGREIDSRCQKSRHRIKIETRGKMELETKQERPPVNDH